MRTSPDPAARLARSLSERSSTRSTVTRSSAPILSASAASTSGPGLCATSCVWRPLSAERSRSSVESMRCRAVPPHMLIRSNAFRERGPEDFLLSSTSTPSTTAARTSASLGVATIPLAEAAPAPDLDASPAATQGWRVISSRLMRRRGSGTRILSMRSRAVAGMKDGYMNSARWILRNSADMVGSSKGRNPASSTKRMTPMDHTSAARPS
mmetsp:Transcript_18696/g.59585  ORF Transcript_18696/g.59585 Transcript_18696/m.59585 type:complete len:211 (-) Transcript_18696:579-1211(-)